MPQSITSINRITSYILRTPLLAKIFVPMSRGYINLAGYRKLGLKGNDLIAEENPIAQKALSRLPEDESYARVYRIIRAHQLELSHHILPKSEWTKPEEDTGYLWPYLLEAEAEAKEKEDMDNLQVSKH